LQPNQAMEANGYPLRDLPPPLFFTERNARLRVFVCRPAGRGLG